MLHRDVSVGDQEVASKGPFAEDALGFLLGRLGERAGSTVAYGGLVRPLTVESFGRLPVTEKAVVRADPPRFWAADRSGWGRVDQTSGTTGGQMVVPRTAAEAARNVVAVADLWRHLLPNPVRMASLVDHNKAVGGLITGIAAALRVPLVPLFPFGAGQGADRFEEVASAFGAVRPTVVVATPGTLLALEARLDAATFSGLCGSVGLLLLLGEPATAGLRRRLQETWAARAVTASYGSTETGTSATGCLNGELHADPHRFILEVRGPGGNIAPLAAATSGELIVTGLYAEAMPLLRYATGDRVETFVCPCRSIRPALRVLGREDDWVTGPDGTRLGAEQIEAAFYAVPGTLNYRLHVDADRRIVSIDVLSTPNAHGPTVTQHVGDAFGVQARSVPHMPPTVGAAGVIKSWSRAHVLTLRAA